MTPPINPDAIAGAFGLAEDVPALVSEVHQHQRDQLLYCSGGAMRLETEARIALLPADRAAWIPAGLPHRATCARPVRLRTVYFPVQGPSSLAVFYAPPLLRELAKTVCVWGVTPPPGAGCTFDSLRWLTETWRRSTLPLDLPRAQTPALRRALERLLHGLAHPVCLDDAARAAHVSVRTLQRKAKTELGLSLSTWLRRARMQHAIELLSDPEIPVGEVALRCGYQSPAAFSRGFTQLMGAPPSRWRSQSALEKASP